MRVIAKSLAGHDKDSIYLVIDEADGMVFLCDGVRRKLSNPKKKKLRHVQLTKKAFEGNLSDEAIREFLRAYGGV